MNRKKNINSNQCPLVKLIELQIKTIIPLVCLWIGLRRRLYFYGVMRLIAPLEKSSALASSKR